MAARKTTSSGGRTQQRRPSPDMSWAKGKGTINSNAQKQLDAINREMRGGASSGKRRGR